MLILLLGTESMTDACGIQFDSKQPHNTIFQLTVDTDC